MLGTYWTPAAPTPELNSMRRAERELHRAFELRDRRPYGRYAVRHWLRVVRGWREHFQRLEN